MKKIVIATHGNLASGAKSTIEFLVGNMAEITCIDAYVNPDENLVETLEHYFKGVRKEDTVIVFTDVKGGSVNQKIVPYAADKNVFLIAGFNLPVLLEVVMAPEQIKKEDLIRMIEESRKQLEFVEVESQEDSEDDFLN